VVRFFTAHHEIVDVEVCKTRQRGATMFDRLIEARPDSVSLFYNIVWQ
jgi:hypothetical protein